MKSPTVPLFLFLSICYFFGLANSDRDFQCIPCTREVGTYISKYDYKLHAVNGTDTQGLGLCSTGFQCVNQHPGLEGGGNYSINDSNGCCLPCGNHQSCPEGTIGFVENTAEMNVCPPGTLCDPSPVSCPAGFVCQNNQQLSCAQLVQDAYDLGFSGVHNGIYCPEGMGEIQGCPAGYYCPDSKLKIICPKGKFCSYKTAVPFIECPRCQEGATEIAYSNSMLLTVPVVVLVCLALFLKYRKGVDEQAALAKASQDRNTWKKSSSTSSSIIEMRFNEIRQKALILHKENPSIYKDPDVFFEGHEISTKEGTRYDAERLFQYLDVDKSRYLDYAEMNKLLMLEEYKLVAFVKVMNSLAGYPSWTKDVTQECFADQFYSTLELYENYAPSFDQISNLYDEICNMSPGETTINTDDMYDSSLTDFLSSIEIYDMVKVLRRSENAFVQNKNRITISKKDFVVEYPNILQHVASDARDETHMNQGMDIAFGNLNLEIHAGKSAINVLHDVTGRIQRGKMTALMGGSGAGKTSLLNALCGRAYYGEVTGSVKINGIDSKIENHKDIVGFVPQDDIVYSELTVKENLMYAGRFQLPIGTSEEEIENLSEETMAALGLTRIRNNLVGDVTRRGVSGGEKKRVNIGLELMKRPKILFLDEPTSGLDSVSAQLVVSFLKSMVDKYQVTIAATIHQPRKSIVELFDNLLLLGAGGKMIYTGSMQGSKDYFERLGYKIQPGENLADWVLDISQGELAPERRQLARVSTFFNSSHKANTPMSEKLLTMLRNDWNKYFDSLDGEEKSSYMAPKPYALPYPVNRQPFFKQLMFHIRRNLLVAWRNRASKVVDTCTILLGVLLISLITGTVEFAGDFKSTVDFELLAIKDRDFLMSQFPSLFDFALRAYPKMVEFNMMVGAIISVLISLAAAGIVTEKRIECFREFGSGYNINAYYIATNITSVLECTIQMLLSTVVSFWLRNSLLFFSYYFMAFVMLAWVASSWAFLFTSFVAPVNVTLTVGFFITFSALLFSGGTEVITYENIYDSRVLELVCSLSPTRFFQELLIVSEFSCLGPQTGYHIEKESISTYPLNMTSFSMLNLARRDTASAVTIDSDDCGGWWWGFLPMLLIGLLLRYIGGIFTNILNRGEKAQKTFLQDLRKNGNSSMYRNILVTILGLLLLSAGTVWSIFRGDLTEKFDEGELSRNMFKNIDN